MWGAQVDKHLCSTSPSDFDLLLLFEPNPTSPTPPLGADAVAAYRFVATKRRSNQGGVLV